MDATKTVLAIGVVWFGLLPCTLAQTTQPADGASGAAAEGESLTIHPYWLRVTGDQVHLRSRADLNSLPVARLRRDTVLRTLGRDGDWYRVEPPAGVFSLVSSEFITREGPDIGVVNTSSGSLRVRMGSTVFDVDPLLTEVQKLLEPGTRIRILGDHSPGWLRIAPPDGVYFYIASNYAEPIDPDMAAKLMERQEQPPQPIPQATPEVTPTEPATEATPPSPTEFPQPEGYRALPPTTQSTTPPPPVQMDATPGSQPKPVAPTPKPTPAPTGVTPHKTATETKLTANPSLEFAAWGMLVERSLSANDNRLYRFMLVDPETAAIRAYLEVSVDQQSRVAKLLGRTIGVLGGTRDVPGLEKQAIDVVYIRTLDRRPAGPTTQPARPTP